MSINSKLKQIFATKANLVMVSFQKFHFKIVGFWFLFFCRPVITQKKENYDII
jgi:hypothetical protein